MNIVNIREESRSPPLKKVGAANDRRQRRILKPLQVSPRGTNFSPATLSDASVKEGSKQKSKADGSHSLNQWTVFTEKTEQVPPADDTALENKENISPANEADAQSIEREKSDKELYWKQLALARETELQASLEANQLLYETIDRLAVENETLRKFARHAQYFGGLLEAIFKECGEEMADQAVIEHVSSVLKAIDVWHAQQAQRGSSPSDCGDSDNPGSADNPDDPHHSDHPDQPDDSDTSANSLNSLPDLPPLQSPPPHQQS